MKYPISFNQFKVLFVFFIAVNSLLVCAYAIDNPDNQNYIGQFESRESVYLEKINKPNNTNRAYLMAYDDYLIFLDKELNATYQILLTKLPEPNQKALKKSQREWIRFRNAEFEFIKNNWTRTNFGSSAGISRGAYRSSIVKNRVTHLLHYAMNY